MSSVTQKILLLKLQTPIIFSIQSIPLLASILTVDLTLRVSSNILLEVISHYILSVRPVSFISKKEVI